MHLRKYGGSKSFCCQEKAKIPLEWLLFEVFVTELFEVLAPLIFNHSYCRCINRGHLVFFFTPLFAIFLLCSNFRMLCWRRNIMSTLVLVCEFKLCNLFFFLDSHYKSELCILGGTTLTFLKYVYDFSCY